jgi:hypothetical protein
MRERLVRGNVLTPASADAENLAPVAYTWLEACLAPPAGAPPPPAGSDYRLPCETLDGVKGFPRSGMVVAGSPRYYAVLNMAKGGVCRAFDKKRGTVTFEDAGYVVRAAGRLYSSQIIGMSRRLQDSANHEVSCATTLSEVRQELLTPSKFLLLRLLNLTLFRSLRLGNRLRRMIVKRLILAKRPGPLRLKRSVAFAAEEIHVRDRLELTRAVEVQCVDLPRSFTPIHMGSAKYFRSSELEETLQVETPLLADMLNKRGIADHEFVVRFPAGDPNKF